MLLGYLRGCTDDQNLELQREALAPDEMYALKPAMVLGGPTALDHLVRVKLDPHLTILRQLAAPEMPYANVDIDKLTKT